MSDHAFALGTLRAEIDAVDSRILELLADRVRLVQQIGAVKHASGMAVHDPTREQSVLERLVGMAREPLDAEMVRRVFERIIDESRRIEEGSSNGCKGP